MPLSRSHSPGLATIGGRIYYASARLKQACAGCAAANRELPGPEQTELCRTLPACSPAQRGDGRAVVWVHAGGIDKAQP